MPLEQIASEVFQAMYQRQHEFSWISLLWTVALLSECWIGYDALPQPPVLQINCGGLGKERLRATSHRTFTAHDWPFPLAIAHSVCPWQL